MNDQTLNHASMHFYGYSIVTSYVNSITHLKTDFSEIVAQRKCF